MTDNKDDALLFDRVSEEIDKEKAGNGETTTDNVIEWVKGNNTVTVQLVSHSKYANRVEKYAKAYPEEVQIVGRNADGSIVAHLPLKYIKITRPAHVEMTEERKEALRQKLAEAREKRH